MSKELFAVEIGANKRDLAKYEAGRAVPPREIVEKLKSLAARAGLADLAVILQSEAWTVQAVYHPGEHFISQTGQRMTDAEMGRRERLHQWLDHILQSGSPDLIELLDMNIGNLNKQVPAQVKAAGAAHTKRRAG